MKLAWKQVIAAFALGAAAGVFGNRSCAPLHGHRGDRAHFQQEMLEQFSKQLTLTTDQRQRVAEILQSKQARIEALRSEIHPKFDEIRNTTRSEIRQLLTPEQQQKFDVMDAAFEARAKRSRQRWDHGR